MIMKKVVLCFFFCLLVCSIQKEVYGGYRKEGIQNFPKSYQPYLLTLQQSSFTSICPAIVLRFCPMAEKKFPSAAASLEFFPSASSIAMREASKILSFGEIQLKSTQTTSCSMI